MLQRLLEGADVFLQNLAPGADRSSRARRGRASPALPASHRLQPVGLRNIGSVCGQEGVRPHHPERGRHALGDGYRGDALQGRRLHRRHLCRHVCLFGNPHRTARTQGHGRRDGRGRRVDRHARRMDGLRGLLHGVRRHAAATHGRQPRDDRAIRPVSHVRRHDHRGRAQQPRVGRVLRAACSQQPALARGPSVPDERRRGSSIATR